MVLQFKNTYQCKDCSFSIDTYSNFNDLDFPECNCNKVAIKTKTVQWDNEDLEKKITVIFDLNDDTK